jgi:5'-3' exonuclease
MDLNGRTTPWEAIILIPFVDEEKLFREENKLIEEGKIKLSAEEDLRNKLGSNLEFTWTSEAEGVIEVRAFEGLKLNQS